MTIDNSLDVDWNRVSEALSGQRDEVAQEADRQAREAAVRAHGEAVRLVDQVERAVYAATFATMMRDELRDPRGGEVAVHEARRAIDAAERAVQLHRAAVRQAREAR